MSGGPVEYRFRVHDGNAATLAQFRAATGGAALTVTSVRGDTAPYLVDAPLGDGAKIDVFSGKVKASTYSGQLADAVTATSPSVLRVFSSLLEDANGQQQLGNRLAAFDFRLNGGAWVVLTCGLLARYTLSSDIRWDVTINDPTQAENGHMAFAPQQDPATGQLETIAQYLARWPNRGCILGGPIRGGFLQQTDRGGWEMTLQRRPNATASLDFVAGYAAPLFRRTTNVQKCDAAANEKTDSLWGNQSWNPAPKAVTFADANASQWTGVIIEIVGVGTYLPASGTFSGDEFTTDGQLESHLVKDIRRRGIYIWDDTWPTTGAANGLPADGTTVRVRALTANVSEISPIYWNGHPVDLLTKLWDEAGIAYDTTAVETTRSAIGADREIALRITAPQEMGQFLESTVYGPFGIGVAVNDQGLLAPFASRVFANTVPAKTITNADAARGMTKPFDLEVTTAIRKVTFKHTKLLLPVNTNDPSTIDGFIVQDESFEWVNNDPGALGTQDITYSVPGMVHRHNANDSDLSTYSYALALDIFSRTGRGMRTGSTKAVRGGNADGLKLGDECLVALKQVPNENRRIGDDNTVVARAMQVVQITPSASGYDIAFWDSGPNAQPFGTLPTISLAASTDAPKTTALFTITNAAALNAAGAGARVQMAVTSGAAPAAGAYSDVAAYAAGVIPTGAVRLPALLASSTVWVRVRSEKSGSRPSNYCAAASLTLTALAAPSALVATPSATDASQCGLTWTPGDTDIGVMTDVFVRLSTDDASKNVRRIELIASSGQYTLEELTAGATYTAGVQHRDAKTGNLSALVEVTFTQVGATVTLDPPKDPTGFSGSQDPQYGFPQRDGVYGLAVAASEFPGFTEFTEEVETAANSGIYGSPVTVAKVPNVQGDWTLFENVAPNDGLRRQLSARHVRDGATASAYTTGVVVLPWTSQPLGKFSQVAGSGDVLRVSATESTDGATRDFKVVVGPLVDTIHVHFRTVAIDVVGDPFDFSESADIPGVDAGSPMILRAPSDGSGVITFSIAHPLRGFRVAGRIIPYTAPPALKVGASWPFDVEAAPPAVNAKLHPSRPTSTTADLSIDIAFAVSDGPVTVDVFEDAASGTTTLLTKSMSAGATIDKTSDPALGGRPLPSGKDSLSWRVRITDVSGQAWWFGPASANRDPLPNGHAVITNYRANPVFTMDFDPDTDSIKVTTHSGKTKTWDAAALALDGSPVTYTVGDALDDATTETALVVDETRSGYKVEYEGGSTWVQIGPGITLHGQPSNPPTAKVELLPDSETSTESVKITPDTQVDEQLLVFYRQGDTDTTPQWRLCASAVDSSARAVVAGTVIGSADYFVELDGAGNPTGSPQTILNAIALTRDQITRHGTMIQGKDSGIQSPWIPVVLSLLGQPWIESFSAEWDQATTSIIARLRGGARCASVAVVRSDASDFSSSPSTQTHALVDGQDLILTFALSAAQLGKTHYLGATPYNLSAEAGLAGAQQTTQVAVPATYTVDGTPTESSGQGTVTLVVADPGALFNQSAVDGSVTSAISWHITDLGVTTVETSTSVPGGGATTGTWTKTVTLDPLHAILVVAVGHFVDGSSKKLGAWTFDSDKISDVVSAAAANNGSTATVTVNWDTDTLVGANCARYSLDGGSTWTSTVTVTSGLLSQFSVSRTGSKQTAIVQAKNAIDSNWGHQSTVEIDAFLTEGPSITAYFRQLTSSTGQVVWSCTAGTALLQIDNGTAATPSSSPISVTLDSNAHTYLFTATLGGQTTAAPVAVPSISADGSGSLLAGSYGACTNSINTYGNPGTVDFGWASTGFDASVKFNVYVNDPGRYGDSLYHNFATTAAGASSYTYTAGESLSMAISPTVDIGFFVEATVNNTNGPRSAPVVTTYGSP